jgi:Uma2 family endonuclease
MMEVFKMLPEGTLAELISGNLYMSPSPTANHQQLILEIAAEMRSLLKSNNLGQVFVAPFDVFLDEHSNAVQPDILFVARERLSIIKPDAVHGTPDLIIEVLSPGNAKHDREHKKALYEKFGVKEYWVIDSDTKESTGFFLKGERFESAGDCVGQIYSNLLNQTFTF